MSTSPITSCEIIQLQLPTDLIAPVLQPTGYSTALLQLQL